jgi:hypothetical protein
MTLGIALSIGSSFTLTSTGTLPTGLSESTLYYIETLTGNTATIVTVPGGTAVNVSGAGSGVNSIAVLSDVPLYQHTMLVSDISRTVLAFGCNDIGSSVIDPMLIRWSDQENPLQWYPQATNLAGSLRLSHGSEIYSALQVRQEILVWTNTALYSLQNLGAPLVWGATLLDSNISSTHPNSVALASGVVYWMGVDSSICTMGVYRHSTATFASTCLATLTSLRRIRYSLLRTKRSMKCGGSTVPQIR